MCDRPTRFRKAILRMHAGDKTARKVTPIDVKNVWSFLGCECGGTPYTIAQEANEDSMSNERFKHLMSLLNSRL